MQIHRERVLAGSVRKLLRRNARGNIARMLAKTHPADRAGVLRDLADRDQHSVFSILVEQEKKLAGETLSNLEPELGANLLELRSPQEIGEILQELESDDAAEFIAALPDELAEDVLDRMRVQDSAEVQGLLKYEDETAGRIMTPNVFALNEDLSVSEAIQAIQTGSELEMVFYLYVVDDRKHLVGVVSLRQLLMVSPSTPLKKVMTTDVIRVLTETDQEEVARQVALYDLLAIPVVDDENKLVGMITVDDVIDVIQEEATEDILHLAGVNTDDRVYASKWQSFKQRIPWLIASLGTALVGAWVISRYESALTGSIAIFLPLVAALAGNAGNQALTVMVRSLALGEVNWSSSRPAIFKELILGLSNGVLIGIIAGAIAQLWTDSFELGMVLAAAMVINLFVAGMVGSLIPLVLKKLRVDPAIASSLFLTTVADVVGFGTYLFLAYKFLVEPSS